MRIDQQAPTEMDLGFELAAAGRYVWQVEEGIKVLDKDDGRRSLQIPLNVDQAVEGDQEAAGAKAFFFVPLIDRNGDPSKYGEKLLNVLLASTGLIRKAAEKFGQQDVGITDDRLLAFLKVELPGKYFEAVHEIAEYEGKKRMDFKSIRQPGKRAQASGSASESSAQW